MKSDGGWLAAAAGRTAVVEARLGAGFALVGLIGFCVDAALLRAGLMLGLTPALARAISLAAAINTTFLINGLLVFKCLTRARLARQWLGYMLTQGGGNLASYLVFITLVSLRAGWISEPLAALTAGAALAFVINFATARLIVFAEGGAAQAQALREATCGEADEAAQDVGAAEVRRASSSPVR